MEKTTNTLTAVLRKANPERLDAFFEENRDELISGQRPFARYMRACLKEKGLSQQEVFIRADLSEGYGYKIISEEKHTHQRDTILRLCFGARFSLEETQRALRIYGMSPLYARVPRDAALIAAFGSRLTDLADVNELLRKNRFDPLKGTEL